MDLCILFRSQFAMFTACCFSLLISPDVEAQPYKCLDAKGKVIYQEGLCTGDKDEGRLKDQESTAAQPASDKVNPTKKAETSRFEELAKAAKREEAAKAWQERARLRQQEVDSQPSRKVYEQLATPLPTVPRQQRAGMFPGTLRGPSLPPEVEKQYPAPWRDDVNVGILTTLAKNGVSGCGQTRYRASSSGDGEYLVHCTSNGTNWRGYLVWPRIESVTGPFAEDAPLR